MAAKIRLGALHGRRRRHRPSLRAAVSLPAHVSRHSRRERRRDASVRSSERNIRQVETNWAGNDDCALVGVGARAGDQLCRSTEAFDHSVDERHRHRLERRPVVDDGSVRGGRGGEAEGGRRGGDRARRRNRSLMFVFDESLVVFFG